MHGDKRDSQTKTSVEKKNSLPLKPPSAVVKGSLTLLIMQLLFKPQQVIFLPHCEAKRPQHLLPHKFNQHESETQEMYYC